MESKTISDGSAELNDLAVLAKKKSSIRASPHERYVDLLTVLQRKWGSPSLGVMSNYVVQNMIRLFAASRKDDHFIYRAIDLALQFANKRDHIDDRDEVWAGLITLAIIPLTGREEQYSDILEAVLEGVSCGNYKICYASCLFLLNQQAPIGNEHKELLRKGAENAESVVRRQDDPHELRELLLAVIAKLQPRRRSTDASMNHHSPA